MAPFSSLFNHAHPIEHGYATVADYYKRRGAIARRVTEGWLRLTINTVDRRNKNQSKSPTLPIWSDISAALTAWGQGRDSEIGPLPRGAVDVSQLTKQADGVLQRALKEMGVEHSSKEEYLRMAMSLLRTLRYRQS